MDDEVMTWNLDNLKELQQFLGPRPGNKHVDPMYIRTGHGNKVYCWDDYSKKWKLVSPGDTFFKREDGTVGHEKKVRA